MKKRLLASLLALCMVLALLPAAAFAEGEEMGVLSEASDEMDPPEAPAEPDTPDTSDTLDTPEAPAEAESSENSTVVADPDDTGILFLASLDGYEPSDPNATASAKAILLDGTELQMQMDVLVDMANSQISGLDEEGDATGGGTTYMQVNTWCMYTKGKDSSTGEERDIYTLTEVSNGTSAGGGVEGQFALDVTDTVYIDKNHASLQSGNTVVYMDDKTVFANAVLVGAPIINNIKILTISDVEFTYQGVGSFNLEVSDQGSVDSAGFAYPAAEIYALYDSVGGNVVAVVTIGGQRVTPAAEYTVTVTHNTGGYVKYGYQGWYNIDNGGSFTVPVSMPSVGAIPYSGYTIGSIVVNGVDRTSQMRYDANGDCQAVEFLVDADTTVTVTFVASVTSDNHSSHSSDDSSPDDGDSGYVASPSTSGGNTTVTVSARSMTSGGTIRAEIKAADMNKAVSSAVSEAIRKGTAPVVEIDVRTFSRADSLEVSLPASSLEKLAEAGNSSLVITSNVAEVALDHAALGALVNQAAGSTITLEVAPVEILALNVPQREAVGTAPVVDLSLASGRTAIHDYGNGVITVSLPYELAFGQSADDVVVYYLESHGGLAPCSTSYADGKVTFTTTHLSKYVIGDKQLAEQAQKSEFTDVPATAYYADAVAWAVGNGIAYGVTDTAFGPDVACTRAQIVSFLWRQAGSPKMGGTNPFTDVSATDYYYDAVLWAVDNGIAYGVTDTTFGPNSTCTRAQAMTFLYRDKKSPAVSGSSSFTDVPAGEYYAGAVQWAVANNVAYGVTGTTFGPGQDCTRAQIISFMYRAK